MQSAHAAVEYAVKHPEVAGCTLVMLTICDESTLRRLAETLELWTDTERFFEPDLEWQLTAIAAGGPQAARKLKGFPLMLGRG